MRQTGPIDRAKCRATPQPALAAPIQLLVEEFLGEVLGLAPGELGPTARFADDLSVDSFDLLEIAVEAQDRFGAEIPDEALADVVTVGDFGRCVSEAIKRVQDSARP